MMAIMGGGPIPSIIVIFVLLATKVTCWNLKSASVTRRDFGTYIMTTAAGCVASDLYLQPHPAEAVDTATVVNSVLSAYGLPNVPEEAGFSKLVEVVKLPGVQQEGAKAIVSFQYPKGWVESRRDGQLGASNYQQGDRCLVTVAPLPAQYSTLSVGELPIKFVTDKIIPGDINSSESVFKVVFDSSKEPADMIPKSWQGYRRLTVKFNTVTPSGYDVEQYLLASMAVVRGHLVCLQASCQLPRKKKMVPALQTIVDTFRVAG